MPKMTDQSDAELSARVAERVMGWKRYTGERYGEPAPPEPESYPCFEVIEAGGIDDDASVRIYSDADHWGVRSGYGFDPPNCLDDAWSACECAKERGMIRYLIVNFEKATVFDRHTPFGFCCTDREDPRASGRLTIALIRALGVEEDES